MLTTFTDKDQLTDTSRPLKAATNHRFAPIEPANAAAYEGPGMAPPSPRSRRAARARRRARNDNSGWRIGIGMW